MIIVIFKQIKLLSWKCFATTDHKLLSTISMYIWGLMLSFTLKKRTNALIRTTCTTHDHDNDFLTSYRGNTVWQPGFITTSKFLNSFTMTMWHSSQKGEGRTRRYMPPTRNKYKKFNRMVIKYVFLACIIVYTINLHDDCLKTC